MPDRRRVVRLPRINNLVIDQAEGSGTFIAGGTSTLTFEADAAAIAGNAQKVVTPAATQAGARYVIAELKAGVTYAIQIRLRHGSGATLNARLARVTGAADVVTLAGGVSPAGYTVYEALYTPAATDSYVLYARTSAATATTFYIDGLPVIAALSSLPGYTDAATVSLVQDLENGSTFQAIGGSFKITPPPAQQTQAKSHRRHGGAWVVGEAHDNAVMEWKLLVAGASADDVATNVRAVLAALLQPTQDLFIEWRPDGQTQSVYREIRGPATWELTYDWAQFVGAKSMYVDVKVPVSPLARGLPYRVEIPTTTVPAVIQLATAVPGDELALADVELRHSGGAAAPVWGLLGWMRRPGSPLSGAVAPFGIIEAETGASLVGWASAADANFRGGNGLRAAAASGPVSAEYTIDPSTLLPDDFAFGEVDLEIWGRFEIAAGIVSPRVVASLLPAAGATFGGERFVSEIWGSQGCPVVRPSSGTVYRPVRLGTLPALVDTNQPAAWKLKIAASWAAGSTGNFGLDFLTLVPARRRAAGVTGRANDSTYPKLFGATTASTKTIRSDLSGRIASGAGAPHPDAGLGGSPIELPPGNVDLLVRLSSIVPGDPTSNTATEQLSHTVSGRLIITPRYQLMRGA